MKQSIIFAVFIFSGLFSYSQSYYPIDTNYFWGVHAFKIIDSVLYVGGGATLYPASNHNYYSIKKWNGNNWLPLSKLGVHGEQLVDNVKAIEKYNNKLFIGGSFFEWLNNDKYLAYLDSGCNCWKRVGNFGRPSNEVNAMVTYKNKLYIAGGFGQIGGIQYYGMAVWNDTNWENIGVMNGSVGCMAVYNNELYVAGSGFYGTIYNGSQINSRIMKWDGSQWQAAGFNISGYANSFYVDSINNTLYVVGLFNLPNDNAYHSVLKWDDEKWCSLGDNVSSDGYSISVYNKRLFVGGVFSHNNSDNSMLSLMYLNSQGWHSANVQKQSSILALQSYKDYLYIGGLFDSISGIKANGLAKLYMEPDTTCFWLQPRVFSDKDTVYLHNGPAEVQFKNNNAYAQHWQWSFGDTVQNPLCTFTAADTGQLTVSVSVTQDGCTKIASKNVLVLLGVDVKKEQELNITDLRIFPNPAGNSITVDVNTADNYGGNFSTNSALKKLKPKVQFSDLQGKILYEENLQQGKSTLQINTSKWSKGTYIYKLVIDGKTVKSEKLVVEQ